MRRNKMLQGSYFSHEFATLSANDDLMELMATELGVSKVVAKKLTLVSEGAITLDINNLGVFSDIYEDTDGLYKLSLDASDCVVSSLVVENDCLVPVFLAIIF